LLPALALEHTDRATIAGIEHGPNQCGLPVAILTPRDWIRFEAGKDFVFELVADEVPARQGRLSKLQSEHLFPTAGGGQFGVYNTTEDGYFGTALRVRPNGTPPPI
jgi:hypothetical protein